jgi:hypothetical protein
MPYEFYVVVHVLGLALALVALGGLAVHSMNGGDRETNQNRRLVAITHGIGMLMILVGGFGLLARIGAAQSGLPPWVYVKLALWLCLGAAMMVATRIPAAAKALFLGLPVLIALGAWTASAKPGSAPAAAPSEAQTP